MRVRGIPVGGPGYVGSPSGEVSGVEVQPITQVSVASPGPTRISVPSGGNEDRLSSAQVGPIPGSMVSMVSGQAGPPGPPGPANDSLFEAIPALFIIPDDGVSEPVDKENYVRCVYKFSTGEEYPGRIRGRGNSTWLLPKKPWKVKFDNNVQPLGLPTHKDFCLLANYLDPSFLRNSIHFKLASLEPGFPFVPRGQHVRVFFNGEYRGVYWFGEDVRTGAARLNYSLATTSATGGGGLNKTGAYILEIDRRAAWSDSEDVAYTTSSGVVVAFDDPDGTNSVNYNYMTQWLDDFEEVLFGDDWLDETTGYHRLVDLPSFAVWYLVNELTANVDSDFFSSVKLLKTRDTSTVPGKLYMAAPWDADLSIAWILPYQMYTLTTENGHGEAHPGAIWIRRMMEDPAFKAVVLEKWAPIRNWVKSPTGLEEWLRKISRNLSDFRASDNWLWSSFAPRVTDINTRQRLVSYLQQRSNLIEAYLVEGPEVYDWEVVTSETFSNPSSGSLIGRYTDTELGGTPMLWHVASGEEIWRIQPDEAAGWDTVVAGLPQQFGLQIEGPIEIEFDKYPHTEGGVRVALGADSMSLEAALGVHLLFTPWGVSAAYPPYSWTPGVNVDVDTRPIWNQPHHIRIRLLNSGMSVWIDDELRWQTDQVSRAGDWVFFEKDVFTRAGGSIIDNIVIRNLPIVLGGEPEWSTVTSDTFVGSVSTLVGKSSNAALGGVPTAWSLNNSDDNGWVSGSGKLGLGGLGVPQVFGLQADGPVQIKFNLVDLPSDSALVTIRLGVDALVSEAGAGVTIANNGFYVGYHSVVENSWQSVFVEKPDPPLGWDASDWRIEQAGSTLSVWVDNAPLFAATDVAVQTGSWVTFRKDTNDASEQWLIRNLQIKKKNPASVNRHPNPGLEDHGDTWGGYGGTFTRSTLAAHSGDYGMRGVFAGDGSGGYAGGEVGTAFFYADAAGKSFSGEVWVRCSVSRNIRVLAEALDDEWGVLGQIGVEVVPCTADVWTKVELSRFDYIPADAKLIKLGVHEAGDDHWGWSSGDILDVDDCVVRIW